MVFVGDAAAAQAHVDSELQLRKQQEPPAAEPPAAEALPALRRDSLRAAKNRRLRRRLQMAAEYTALLTSALILASLIRAFLGLAFWIPSPSMFPTLKIGDRVVVSRLSYRLHEPRRGDVVVFQNPGWVSPARTSIHTRVLRGMGEFVGVGQPRDKNYIKRIVGLPGETVEGKSGRVWINGKPLDEPYLPSTVRVDDFEVENIPPGQFWVMGDNRSDSCDSRCMTDPNGDRAKFIELDAIVGRAFVRVWPIPRIGKT